MIAARYKHDPYGNVRSRSGAVATNNPFRFSTKYADGETGLVYYGYRFYSQRLARWLSRDPINELAFRVTKEPEFMPAIGKRIAERVSQSAQRYDKRNLYLFVSNEPVSRFDKLGLQTQTPKWKDCNRPLVWRQKGAGHVPRADGCSFPGWAQILAKVIGKMPWSGSKDNPTGQCSFQWVCNIHDGCYSLCERSQEDCDSQFWNNLNMACNFCGQAMPSGPARDAFGELCNEWADLFLWAVQTFGESAYKNRQELNCECQCPMPAGVAP